MRGYSSTNYFHFSISLTRLTWHWYTPIKHTDIRTGIMKPSEEVWHAFVRAFFSQQGAGDYMQRRLPLLCESFVSPHPQAPPLFQSALQWESLQVLTLSGGGQSQVRDLLLGYHQISGWGRQQRVALSFRACHVILFICRQLSGRQKGYLAHNVVMKHIKILKPAMLSIGSSTWHMPFFTVMPTVMQ